MKKNFLLSLVLSLAFVLCVNSGVFAQEEEGPNLDGILEGVNISGFATAAYQYNASEHTSTSSPVFTGVSGGGRDALGFPNFLEFRDDNSINLEAVEIQVFKEATEEHPVGFGFVTNYGEIARNLTFGGRFPNGDHDNNDEDRFALQAGYVQWLIPIGKGIDFRIGKFATWIGAELIEDVDNPNLTHGHNYNNSIPFTHTGLSLGYQLTDTIRVTGFLVNGWDTFVDSNNAKTGGWQVAWTPNDRFSFVANGIHGAERPDNDEDLTHLFDLVSTVVVTDKLSLLLNFDYGWNEEDSTDTDGDGFNDEGANSSWAGGAITAIYQFTDWMNLAWRYEYTDYTDEFGLNVWETTITLNIRVSDNLLIRPEYRHNDFGGSSSGKSRGSTGIKKLDDIRPTFSADPGRDTDDIFAIGFSYIF